MGQQRIKLEMATGDHLESTVELQSREAEGSGDDQLVVMDRIDIEFGQDSLGEARKEADPATMADQADRVVGERRHADRHNGDVGAETIGYGAHPGDDILGHRIDDQIRAGLLMSRESTGARCEQLAHHLLVYGRPLTPDALAGWADTDTLTGIILDGMPGTAMPPWRPILTEEEARWIANYLMQGEISK